MRSLFRVTLLVAASFTMARAAAAQISGLVTPGERLRLETSDLGRFEAVAMTAGETVLRVDRNGERLEIATADIRRIWVRRRATGTGAIIGGAVGLAAGITYGLLITRPESSPCDADNCTRAGVTAASGAIGAAIGAGAGALIGTLIPRWRLRFP